jgi:hypothetical protein
MSSLTWEIQNGSATISQTPFCQRTFGQKLRNFGVNILTLFYKLGHFIAQQKNVSNTESKTYNKE